MKAPILHRARGRMKLPDVLKLLEERFVMIYWTMPIDIFRGRWAVIIVRGRKRHNDGTGASQ